MIRITVGEVAQLPVDGVRIPESRSVWPIAMEGKLIQGLAEFDNFRSQGRGGIGVILPTEVKVER